MHRKRANFFHMMEQKWDGEQLRIFLIGVDRRQWMGTRIWWRGSPIPPYLCLSLAIIVIIANIFPFYLLYGNHVVSFTQWSKPLCYANDPRASGWMFWTDMGKGANTWTLSWEIFGNCGNFLIVEDYAPLFSEENLFLVEMFDKTFNIRHIYSL